MFLPSYKATVYLKKYRICCVMVCMHASNVVDREFELWSGQTEDHKNGINCYDGHFVLDRLLNWIFILLAH
jgi:hypothetical protein